MISEGTIRSISAVIIALAVAVGSFAVAGPANALSLGYNVRALTIGEPASRAATIQRATLEPATVQPATVQPAIVQPATLQPLTRQPAPQQSATQSRTFIARLTTLAATLRSSTIARDVDATVSGQTLTFHISSGVTMTFSYGPTGSPIVGSSLKPGVGSGADPWPYITLDTSEQAALATGAGATVIALICLAIGPESVGIGCIVAGGIGSIIIGIAYAHGICPHGRTERIYIFALSATCT